MTELNNTPINVEKIVSGYTSTNFQTIVKKNFMGVQLDRYSLVLFITGLLFIASILAWGYTQFFAQ